jgi:hypothetical protein
MSDASMALDELAPTIRLAFNGLGKGSVTPQVVRFYDAFNKMTAQSPGTTRCQAGCTIVAITMSWFLQLRFLQLQRQ